MPCVQMSFQELKIGDSFIDGKAIQVALMGDDTANIIYIFKKTDGVHGESDVKHKQPFEPSRPVLRLS